MNRGAGNTKNMKSESIIMPIFPNSPILPAEILSASSTETLEISSSFSTSSLLSTKTRTKKRMERVSKMSSNSRSGIFPFSTDPDDGEVDEEFDNSKRRTSISREASHNQHCHPYYYDSCSKSNDRLSSSKDNNNSNDITNAKSKNNTTTRRLRISQWSHHHQLMVIIAFAAIFIPFPLLRASFPMVAAIKESKLFI